jgi:hypothetical protein
LKTEVMQKGPHICALHVGNGASPVHLPCASRARALASRRGLTTARARSSRIAPPSSSIHEEVNKDRVIVRGLPGGRVRLLPPVKPGLRVARVVTNAILVAH